MLTTTSAVVLKTIKYGETSLIVKCFTAANGPVSYMVKGARSSKKKGLKMAYFQPLTLLEITSNHKNKGGLESLRSAKILHPFSSISENIAKSSIALFLSEILYTTLVEEEPNLELYLFIENAVNWLDTEEQVANFHLLFLLTLSKYLGFYPDVSGIENRYFNLEEGVFCETKKSAHCQGEESVEVLKYFLGTNFDSSTTQSFTSNQRQATLELLMNYFRLHLHGFEKPKSLSILYEIFRDK